MTANELKRRAIITLALALVISACVALAYAVLPVRTHTQGTVHSVPAVQVSTDTHDEHLHTVVTVPACEEEDASGAHDGPVCRWDAETDGLANGGYSYWAVHLDSCRVQFQYDRLPWETIDEC